VLACARWLLPAVKLIGRIADNSFVQKSAIITGLTLALGAATLAGIGERASSGFDSSPADTASAETTTAPDYAANRSVAMAPLPPSILATAPASPLANSPEYTIRRTVPEVRLQFTVADEQGRLVQNLSPADVRVLDNQSPVERFSDFERDENLPLRLGIVLDTSDSVKAVLPDEKNAALDFLNRVMRPQTDRAFVMAFGASVRVWQTSTVDRAGLIAAVGSLKEPGWGTKFYDALHQACEEQLSSGEEATPVHRALIVLSDGEDTQSFHDPRDVMAVALRDEIQIYALTLHNKQVTGRGDFVLQQLADSTGGRYYVAQSSKELPAVFTQIEQDLRTQYYVSFPPQGRPGFHSLQVQVRAGQRLQVHARQGYYVAQ